jgi:hypothetical protein
LEERSNSTASKEWFAITSKGETTMISSHRRRILALLVNLGLFVLTLTFPSPAVSQVKLLKGQTIYAPAYSHIYHGDREQPFYLTVTLSIRNTDPDRPITIVSLEYYDTDGKLIKRYLKNEVKLGAMASTRYVVKESDRAGGSGANFIVRWKSDEKVTEPIVESIMISTQTQQGVSFTSRGQAIEEDSE